MSLSRTSYVFSSCYSVSKWCTGCNFPPRPGMFVSHARVRIVGLGPKIKKRRFQRRRLAIKEVIRMPCLMPTIVTVILGLLAVAGGAGMSVVGYIPSQDYKQGLAPDGSIISSSQRNSSDTQTHKDLSFYVLKTCSYLGPLLMAVGMFAMIVSCVFYCEILDKYSILVPDKKSAVYTKDELYEIIIGEMKKSYAQTLITAYTKAAERNMMIDNKSVSGDFLPDPIHPFKPTEPLSLEQQIDIECEGYTPSPPIPNKRYSVIQARIQRLRSEDNWLKTSSLPNIRRSEHPSIRRVSRLRSVKKHSLSCDYTMDEARLRRKSMMLRSIILGNSSSSGDLHQKRTRRFSSAKFLPSENTMSLEEMSHFTNLTGSFPLTRLIQRRGTFACGDMRTRRMKFLLLLQASESKERLSDTMSMDGRASIAGIRRNSFIPYTTCDKFIAGEEKKHNNKDRRASVNPFTTQHRFGSQAQPPGMRRHSFFPVRREEKMYPTEVNEQRRHSYNPTCINNTMKSEYASKGDNRRGSYNPDGSQYDRSGDISRRGSYVPPKKSNFLQVPGFETDPILSERHPSAQASPTMSKSSQSRSDSQFTGHKSNNSSLNTLQSCQDSRVVERRHSYQPSSQGPVSSQAEASFKVPKIVISSDSNNRFLSIPQDYPSDERRHSFNAPTTTKLQTFSSTAVPSRHIERPVPQRISFKLMPDNSSSPSPPQQTSSSFSSSHASSLPTATTKTSKLTSSPNPSTSEKARPSGFKQEMIVFSPLTVPDSRSISPVSNISCCGSEEKVGSERSARTVRMTSVSSERTAMTITPLSVTATDSVHRDESLERPPSPSDLRSVDYDSSREDPDTTMPFLSSTSVSAELYVRPESSSREKERHFSHNVPPFRSKGHRHTGIRSGANLTDSPASTSSGPATLLPTSSTDVNASLYRSQSASAISSTEEASDPSFVSYATLSPSASTARPSVKAKTVRAKQRLDTDKS